MVRVRHGRDEQIVKDGCAFLKTDLVLVPIAFGFIGVSLKELHHICSHASTMLMGLGKCRFYTRLSDFYPMPPVQTA
jgi:hypothetical protein